MKKKNEKQMLSSGEVMAILGISRGGLRRVMGDLEFYQIGQSYRFPIAGVKKYLADQKGLKFKYSRGKKNGH